MVGVEEKGGGGGGLHLVGLTQGAVLWLNSVALRRAASGEKLPAVPPPPPTLRGRSVRHSCRRRRRYSYDGATFLSDLWCLHCPPSAGEPHRWERLGPPPDGSRAVWPEARSGHAAHAVRRGAQGGGGGGVSVCAAAAAAGGQHCGDVRRALPLGAIQRRVRAARARPCCRRYFVLPGRVPRCRIAQVCVRVPLWWAGTSSTRTR